MAIQKIITIPDPILRQKSKSVESIDKRVFDMVKDLTETLGKTKTPKGVGISAPQIGKLVRICLVYSKESKKLLTLINPEIIWKSKRISKAVPESENPYREATSSAYEGCLSAPELWGSVERHKTIRVRYQTLNNQTIVRKFSGFTGIVAQHEIDHLDGILFIDRILQQKGKLYQIEKDKEGKEEFVEVKL